MKSKKTINLYIFILAAILAWLSPALSALETPELKNRVNDLAGVLKPSEAEYLENMLKTTEDKTSSQVALLVIPSLEGESLEEFSLRVAEKAKLGQKKLDNGVLVVVALAEKKIRIEVGYGLEPYLTDAKSSYIIRKGFVPGFEKGRYFDGIHDGLQAITGVITKEYDISPEELAKFQKDQKKTKGPHISMGFIVFIVIIILGFFKNAGRGGGVRGAASAVLFGSMMSGSGHSSSSSSFGGGGFSGGGGSFGGGGSSGGW
jgi:uncharacterized protein